MHTMEEREMTQRPVVVIGAGPAGLASAAELRRRGVPVMVLERAEAVAASWRGRYDRLRLNSSRWLSQLPGMRWPRGTGVFPGRDDVVRYLEAYAERGGVEVRVNTRVDRIDRDPEGWTVRTPSGDVAASQVIVATGYDHTPDIPAWPGRESYRGRLLHAAEYKEPSPYEGRDVLVVGPGCSGMEIAYELATNGARRVRLAVRTPPNILLRSPVGPLLARLAMHTSPERADAVMAVVRRRMIGDLSEYGLPVPAEGIFTRLHRLRVAPAIIDKQTLDAIRDRRIEIVRAVDALDEHAVHLADGSRLEPDAVIAATGYRTGLEPIAGHLGVLDERGVPLELHGEAAPGLRFIGYLPRPAHIGLMGQDARRAAAEIAAAWPAERRSTWRGRRRAAAAGLRGRAGAVAQTGR